MNKKNVLGYDICNTDYDEMIKEIKNVINNKEKKNIFAVNPNKIMLAQKDKYLQSILQQPAYLIPDGAGILLASSLNKTHIKNRITGIGLFEQICKYSKDINAKIFLIGAKKDVLNEAVNVLYTRYPKVKIVGAMDGYIGLNEEYIQNINASGANILAVGLGSPKQEKWIFENADKLKDINIFIGVGGTFDVISGRIKRSPLFLRKIGFEWLYRIYRQPVTRVKNVLFIIQYLLHIRKKIKSDVNSEDYEKKILINDDKVV